MSVSSTKNLGLRGSKSKIIESDIQDEIILGGNFVATSPNDFYPSSGIVTLNEDGTLDNRFNTEPRGVFSVTLSRINSCKLQNDGKLLIGGNWRNIFGLSTRLVRYNSDGTFDSTIVSGSGIDNISEYVTKIELQSDGKILVGGNFTRYSGTTVNRIVRLNISGSIDDTFVIGTGFIGTEVLDIAVQSDEKILVGGSLTSYNGTAINRIVRLNSNGTIDSSFPVNTGFNNTVRSIAIQHDGKILVGGDFTSYNGVSYNRIVRLNSDGSVDDTFSIGTGFSSAVYDIQITSDGKILVGGDFTSYNGVSYNRIVRLNSDGSRDISFVISGGFNNRVRSIKSLSNGYAYVCGSFTSYKGNVARYIVKITDTGDVDYTFNTKYGITTGTLSDTGVFDIEITSDNKIIFVGHILGYGGQVNNYIVNINHKGEVNSETRAMLAPVGFTNGQIYSIISQNDGRILIGGSLSSKLFRFDKNWNRDTSLSLGTSFNSGVSSGPRNMVIDDLGRIIIIGFFSSYQGVTFNNIVRILNNGTIDNSFNTGTGFSGTPNAISIQSDGKILIAGGGSTYNGQTNRGLIRLNEDGSVDNTLEITNSITVNTILVQSDGKIIIGGDFTSYNGQSISPSNSLVRINPDGSRDFSFVPPNVRVARTIIQTIDDKILVGGGSLTKLNQDGSTDSSFINLIIVDTSGGDSGIHDMKELSDGKLIVVGGFSIFNNRQRRNFALLLPNGRDSGVDFNLNRNVNTIFIKK
jgi:uncharacterized delta-60 repeat protein